MSIDSGINISASKKFGSWLPFLRANWADKGCFLGVDRSVSAGFAYYGLGRESDNLGIAVNWADSNASNNQLSIKAFYLMKFYGFWEISPTLQYVQDPANNPDDDSVFSLGIRTRLFW